MTSKNCLNCEKELVDQYCSGCGQKADTHRISLKNFVFHDVLHGTFHIERGMLFTARQALTRPGKAALDYISGKRKRYYNVFYLILITLGLIVFLHHFYDELFLLQGGKIPEKKLDMNEASRKFDELFSQKSKIIIFLFVPLAALNGLILFRRKKLNLSEHSIIAGMVLLGMLMLSALGNLFFYLDLVITFNATFSYGMSMLVTTLIILHVVYGYFNAFGDDYSKLGFAYRIVLFFGLFLLDIAILFYLAFGIITNWEFGTVNLSPFG